MKALPSLQAMWNEYGGKGLNMFLLESQGTEEDKLKTFLAEKGVTAPVFMGGLASYPGDNGLPFAYVIGVDGKVVFEGRGNYEAVIKTELAKIKYPGLGKIEIAKGLEGAAANFVARQYAKAIADCNKVLDKSKDDAAKADAQFIIDRCNAEAERLKARADKFAEEKHYVEAIAALETIAAGFKGMEVATAAADKVKEWKKDKEIKKELDAQVALNKLVEATKNARTKAEKAKPLRDFAKKYEGTRAAMDASVLADKAEAG
ncbi:MAG: hypothetical protein IT462_15390 [Planctomycetes bacterium]|nr:hypothetical protein [Planctomycetota bacterium]